MMNLQYEFEERHTMTESWKNKKRLTKKEKTQKGEALKRSRLIYARREGNYPEVKECLRSFLDEMKKGHWIITKRYEPLYRKAIRVFILDLFVAHETDPETYLSYSRSKDDYLKAGRFGKLYLSYNPTMKVKDFLQMNGYIEDHEGRYDKNTNKGRYSRMKATDKLIKVLKEEYKIEIGQYCWDWDESSETVTLRDENKEDIKYTDTPDTLHMKENLRTINKALERHAVLLYITDDEYRDLFVRMQKSSRRAATDFTRKFIKRVFNNSSWEQGGRFYGGWWQNIPREYRHLIRLTYKDVVECDYSGLHVNMLYAKEGLPMPEGDVYSDIPGHTNSDDFRAFVKQLLLILVNSDDKEKAREAIQDTVYRKKRLKLPTEQVHSVEGKYIYPLIDAFAEKHTGISKYFCTGAGIDLQYLDSQIAEQVMVHFTKWNYAILPMHDSFIIHHGLEQELKECMNKAFKDMFNTDINVDLKYNSIEERQKTEPNDPGPCELSLAELIEQEKQYSIYHKLLNQFRDYKQSKKK